MRAGATKERRQTAAGCPEGVSEASQTILVSEPWCGAAVSKAGERDTMCGASGTRSGVADCPFACKGHSAHGVAIGGRST